MRKTIRTTRPEAQFPLISSALAVTLAVLGCTPADTQGPQLAAELSYLEGENGIAWIVAARGDVFIGFTTPLPGDWQVVTRGAAAKVSRKSGDSSVHVFAVTEDQRALIPDGDFRYQGQATARGGQVTAFEP